MQKISNCLWFDTQGVEAANFYVSLFKNAGLGAITYYDKASAEISGQPEGSVLTVTFELEGCSFMALNGGPHFKLTPSISFLVYCETPEEVDELYAKLSEDGEVLMPLQQYPFSERYAWVQDRFGLSWQLYLGSPRGQKIVPSLLYVGEQSGKAEEAMQLYTTVFKDSSIEGILRYGTDEAPDVEGTVKHASFWLNGQEFMAMDSNHEHGFTFNEAVSFIVDCKDQAEIDYFWEKLTENGEEGPCGWLKDRFGVSWQIVPTVLSELLEDEDKEKASRAMEAMLQMKKLDIQALLEAFNRS